MPFNRVRFISNIATSSGPSSIEISGGVSVEHSNSSYLPFSVQYVSTIDIVDVSDLSSIVDTTEYAVLTGQSTGSENGLYLQSGVSAFKQTLSDVNKNWFFLDIKNADFGRAVYLESNGYYIYSRFNKVLLEKNITLTSPSDPQTQTEIFEIPVPYEKICNVKLQVTGYLSKSTPRDYYFYGEYTRIFFNKGSGAYIDHGSQNSTTRNSSPSNFPSPIITFTSSPPTLYLKNGSGTIYNVEWFIKTELLF
jgi:hypothetical protein